MSHATGDLGCQAGPPVSEDNLGHEFEAKRDLPRQEAEAHTRHKLISFDMREEVCLCLCVCVLCTHNFLGRQNDLQFERPHGGQTLKTDQQVTLPINR